MSRSILFAASLIFFISFTIEILLLIVASGERKSRFVKIVRRYGFVFILIGVTFHASNYYDIAMKREAVSKFHDDKSDSDRGIYTARYGYMGNRMILLRVYRTSDMSLLAERTYYDSEAPLLAWSQDRLSYGPNDGDFIKLPPTLLDRLRARLP